MFVCSHIRHIRTYLHGHTNKMSRLPLEAQQEHTITQVLDWRIRLVLNNCRYVCRYVQYLCILAKVQSACNQTKETKK